MKLSALKIAVFANASINLLEESSYNNSYTYIDEGHLNLDIFFLFVIASLECRYELRY